MSRVFKINSIGASYKISYSDVEFACKSCNEIVTRMSYSERDGVAEWTCSQRHLSTEKIGV